MRSSAKGVHTSKRQGWPDPEWSCRLSTASAGEPPAEPSFGPALKLPWDQPLPCSGLLPPWMGSGQKVNSKRHPAFPCIPRAMPSPCLLLLAAFSSPGPWLRASLHLCPVYSSWFKLTLMQHTRWGLPPVTPPLPLSEGSSHAGFFPELQHI